MNRTRIILAAIILAAALLGCVDIDRDEWQQDVLERQRQPGQPGNIETVEATPSVEVAERTE